MSIVRAFKAATAKGGADADIINLVETAPLPTVETGANVADPLPGASDVVIGRRSTKGVIILNGADETKTNTLPEWVAIATIMTGDDNVTVIKFGDNSYVFRRQQWLTAWVS